MAKLPFKAPKLTGSTFGFKNTLVFPLLGIGLAGIGGYLYMKHGKQWNLPDLFGPPKPKGPILPQAVRVSFNVYPPVIKPFRKLRLQGQFEDFNGQPAAVPFGYYSIFESVPSGPEFAGGRLLVSKGIVGQNVGAFRTDVPTDNFRTGPYTVYVSNKPINDDPLKGQLAQQNLLGDKTVTIG